uniref:Uncharacterized protein n=2 Tax=Zymoseptoria tritici TaxID=1047171 RepID=A9Y5I6_ZYMTI|nr:hypothetical protein [Zymoseptoria tritici]ABU40273.1 unknown [Zymoseptoria tritici]AYO45645.1 hypothetical protein [Zymoseptoria tritici]
MYDIVLGLNDKPNILHITIKLPRYWLGLDSSVFSQFFYNLSHNLYEYVSLHSSAIYNNNYLLSEGVRFTHDRFMMFVIRGMSRFEGINFFPFVNSYNNLGNNNLHNCLELKTSSIWGLMYYTNNNLLLYAIFILTVYLMRTWSGGLGEIISYLLYYLFGGRNLVFIMVLLSFISVSGAKVMELTYTEATVFIILATLGSVLFLIFGTLFDFYSYKWKGDKSLKFKLHSNEGFNLFKLLSYNRVPLTHNSLLGVLYLFNIIAGVFSTNGVWYLLQSSEYISNNNLLLCISSAISTIIFALIWYILRKNLVSDAISKLFINSIFRSIMELASFNSVALTTYIMWSFWKDNVDLANNSIMALILGLMLHLLFSYFTIYSEMKSETSYLYGFYYYLSFLGVAFSTNGFYELLSRLFEYYYVYTPTIILTCFSTLMLYPDVYRYYPMDDVGDTNSNLLWSVVGAMVRYYLLVLSFVVLNQLIFNFI